MPMDRRRGDTLDAWPMSGLGWYDGQAQVMHRHPEGQLIYPLAGALAITTEVGTWVAAAERVAWTPPGYEHSHRALPRAHVAALMIPAELGVSLPDRPCVFGVSGLLREAMLVIAGDRPLRAEARERLERVLIDELVDAGPEGSHLPEPRDDRLRAATALLRADPADNRTLPELGRAVGASARTLSRLFQGELGMGFHQWRTQLRLQHALVLLWNGSTVAETAVSCGWSNPSSFVEAFRANIGQTPGRYRARRGEATVR